jgi:hypothetical protein
VKITLAGAAGGESPVRVITCGQNERAFLFLVDGQEMKMFAEKIALREHDRQAIALIREASPFRLPQRRKHQLRNVLR